MSFFKIVAGLCLGLGLLTMGPMPSALAAKDPIYTGYLSSLAVQGHDPVAYFTEARPVEGSSQFELVYQGATWRFSSAGNLAAFQAAPEKYAPQYGGYCAWAVSQGYTAKGDANHWNIVDGKLYLNYSSGVKQTWEQDVPGNIRKANQNWPRVIQ